MRNHGSTDANTRLALLCQYLDSLERGNLDAAAALLKSAETDSTLEAMLLAANDTYLEPLEVILMSTTPNDMEPQAARSATTQSTGREIDLPAVGRPPSPPLSPPPSPPRSHRTISRWAAATAAALVVFALIGGFFVLFTTHPAPSPGQVSSSPTVGSVSTPGTVGPNPGASQASIIVGTQSGAVIALRTDGSTLWYWGNHQSVDSLAHTNGVVYVASHPMPATNDNQTTRLTALRASDGAQLWQTTEPQLQGYTSLAVDGDTLLSASCYGDGTVYSLDTRTGKTRWTYGNTSGRGCMLITGAGGIAYIDGVIKEAFNALDERTGTVLWSYTSGEGPAVTTGTNGPTIVAGSGKNSGLVYYYHFDLISLLPPNAPAVVAFQARTGAVQKTLAVSEVGRPLLVTPDGIAYTAQNNQLCAFRVADATALWCATSFGDAQNVSVRLVATPTTLFYSRLNGNTSVEVGALDVTTGARRWSWTGPASLSTASNSLSLVGNQNALYLATRSGLYAFELSTGHVLWHALSSLDLSFIQPATAG